MILSKDMKSIRYNWIFALLLIGIVLVSGCSQIKEDISEEVIKEPNENSPVSRPKIIQKEGLGDICTYEECDSYCRSFSRECEEYCADHQENALCQERFAFMNDETKPIKPHQPSKENCEGTKIKFDYAPVNLEKTLVLQPLGLMTGSHVTPIDHQYFQNFDNEIPDIEVYSPGDGFITSIQHMFGSYFDKNKEIEWADYRVVIQHTCTISSTYIHIDLLSDKIAAKAPEKGGYANVRIPVEAGEVIGYYASNVDYNLVDEEFTLSGFVVPEHYDAEPWKIHVPNTLEYFNEPVRIQLIGKSLRTAKPVSGKIDYDIDGKLVGNWFLEGTNGYAGADRRGYWKGHMAVAYDAYDPSRIVLSIGGYDGSDSKQFGVKGNKPDPADVGVGSLTKYELIEYDYYDSSGKFWDRKNLVKNLVTKSNENVIGVVLFELTEDRKLKMEFFSGKKASQVSGFGPDAKVYER
jgi:hypothetical protein